MLAIKLELLPLTLLLLIISSYMNKEASRSPAGSNYQKWGEINFLSIMEKKPCIDSLNGWWLLHPLAGQLSGWQVLCSVVLADDGQSIPCHRLLLSAASKFFHGKFVIHAESL